MMRTKTLLLIVIFLASIYFTSAQAQFAIQPPTVNIPPTNAFDHIHTSNATLNAMNFSAPFTVVGSSGISVTGSNNSKTIYITGNGGKALPTTYCQANYGFVSYNYTTNTVTCGLLNQTGSGSGVTSLNTLTGAVTVAPGTNINSITTSGSTITINAAGWQNNTGSNLGTSGTGIFSSMSGSILQFLKLISSNSFLSITSNSTNVIFNIPSMVTHLIAGTGISVNQTSGNILITNTGVTGIAATTPVTVNATTGGILVACPSCSTSTDTNTAQISNAQNSGNGLFGSRLNATANTIKALIAGTGLTMVSNSTAITISSSISDTNTAQISNADHANQGLFGSRLNATANTIKSIGAGRGMTDSSNSTHVTITNNMVFLNTTSKTTSYTVLSTDNLIYVNATGGNTTITIPSISTMGTGKQITIKKIDYSRNYVEIVPTSSTIDYFTNANLTNPMDSLTLDNNGTTWFAKNKLIFTDNDKTLKNSVNSWFGGWAMQGTPTTLALSNNTLYAYPITISRTTILAKIQEEITTLGTGSNCRMAIYTDSGQGYPVNKIQGSDFGSVSSATTGVKTNTFTSKLKIPEGHYYLAVDCNDTTQTPVGTITTDVITSPITASSSSNATQNISITIGSNSNRALVVAVSFAHGTSTPNNNNNVISTVKLGSLSFTKAVNSTKNNATSNNSFDSELWYLVAPPTGAQHITITPASVTSYHMVAGAYSLYNVHQTTPLGVTTFNGSTTNPATTRSSAVSLTPTNTNAWLIENIFGVPTSGFGTTNASPVSPSDTSAWNTRSTSTGIDGASEYKTLPTINGNNKITWQFSGGNFREIVSDVGMELRPTDAVGGTMPTVRSIPFTSLSPLLGMPSTMGATNGGTMYTVPFTMGSGLLALPDPYPTSGYTIATSDVPEILVNVVG